MTSQSIKLEQRVMQLKGVEADMLESLKGKILYVHEGDIQDNPFVGKIAAYGENFVKFTEVVICSSFYDRDDLNKLRKDLENRARGNMQDLPVLYKNKNDIATMIELYPAEAK
jgi:hypothetical protein